MTPPKPPREGLTLFGSEKSFVLERAGVAMPFSRKEAVSLTAALLSRIDTSDAMSLIMRFAFPDKPKVPSMLQKPTGGQPQAKTGHGY